MIKYQREKGALGSCISKNKARKTNSIKNTPKRNFWAKEKAKNGLNTGQNGKGQTNVLRLQNRVPRVQVLLPLPSKKRLKHCV